MTVPQISTSTAFITRVHAHLPSAVCAAESNWHELAAAHLAARAFASIGFECETWKKESRHPSSLRGASCRCLPQLGAQPLLFWTVSQLFHIALRHRPPRPPLRPGDEDLACSWEVPVWTRNSLRSPEA